MCGRFTLELDDTFYPRYEVSNMLDLESNFNITPYSYIPVILKNSPKKIVQMRWGYLPPWSKEYSTKYSVINTRSESVESKTYFKHSILNRRCIIPTTGFFEWESIKDEKRPYLIHLPNSKYFSLAGIYSVFTDALGKEFPTCSILTTTANSLISKIHDRMPVILKKEDEDTWLDKDIKDINIIKQYLKPYNPKDMSMYMVEKYVNSPKNNSKEILKPLK